MLSLIVCLPLFSQGVNVREKAKQLVTLLKDEERLREERIHALKTKEKMAQTSSGEMDTLHSSPFYSDCAVSPHRRPFSTTPLFIYAEQRHGIIKLHHCMISDYKLAFRNQKRPCDVFTCATSSAL